MGPIVGLGFGPAATPAFVVTFGFGIGVATAPVFGGVFLETPRNLTFTGGAGPQAERGLVFEEVPRNLVFTMGVAIMDLRLKRDGEVRQYQADFQYEPEIASPGTDTIATFTSVTAANARGGTGAVPTFTGKTIATDKKSVYFTATGGVVGNFYLLTVTVLTTAGWTLERLGTMEVSTR